MGSRCRRLASSAESGAQTMPEVWRMMNAIFSGVHSAAATNRSPSFSRSSSSVTTTISPRLKASITSPTRWWLSDKTLSARMRERPCDGSADLAALPQIVIGEHACHHRLADRHRADADARIMPSLGDDLGLAPVAVDGAARGEDRRGRLDGEARHDRLAGGDAAENAAGVIGQEARPAVVAHAHLVGVLLAGQERGSEAIADLDPFDRVDPHQGGGEIAVELAVDRGAEPRRDAFGHHLDHRAGRGPALAHVVEELLEDGNKRAIR